MIRLGVLAGALALALMAAGPAGAEIVKHSGTLADVDRDGGTIVLVEMGPWRHDPELTLITMRTIHAPSGTEFVLAYRTLDAPSGYPGDFAEERLEPWQVYLGDFVTVDCEHRDGRLVARRIAVVDEFSR